MLVVLLAVVSVAAASGCIESLTNGGDEEPVPGEIASEARAVTTTLLLADGASPADLWRCEHLLQDIKTVVDALAQGLEDAYRYSHAQGLLDLRDSGRSLPEEIIEEAQQVLSPEDNGDGDDPPPEEVVQVDAFHATRSSFGDEDLEALGAACNLFGRHSLGLQHWQSGDLDDACDVWEPAHVDAEAWRQKISSEQLHSITSKVWGGAWGIASEAAGKCRARADN